MADNPLLVWLSGRDDYLAEMLRMDGRGDYTSDTCCQCGSDPALFRCDNCCDMQLYCGDCTVYNHLQCPTHCIKEWTGSFFITTSLKKLSLRIQLGHTTGESCILPCKSFNDNFILVDTNGIHEMVVDFCGCETSQTHTKQLLRMGWFPSTTVDPRTVATFRLLHHYQILSFESKASAYEFYHSLVHISNNVGLIKKDRYESFMYMVREWRHLKMLKHFGRGHDPVGVSGTKEGECAVLCPACPQPGKNLPPDWKEAPKAKQWLYSLFVAIDANFCLKRRNISNDEVDPSLSEGWSYFVEEKKFKSHLKEHLSETQEKSSCSNHNAVNMAETKLSQGLAATGRPNGVGDLQKGEKYINMDYLFFSTLRNSRLNILNVSYDIACQWHKNLWSRMKSLSESYHISYLCIFIQFFVPKFHLLAHVNKCQTLFSFNFARFVSRTDGEAPKCGWSNINPVASSTKAMGPGCRRDTLDNHFRDWNWKKVVGLGTSLAYKMQEAVIEKADHEAAFQEFNAAISPDHRSAWTVEMEKWEETPNDTSLTNPLECKSIHKFSAARLKLAQMEAEELAHGIDLSLHPDISPSVLIASGLDLKEEQRRVRAVSEEMGLHVSDTQKGTLTRMRNVLHLQILTTTVVPDPCQPFESAEDIRLWLPSNLKGKPCDSRLRDHEWDLRYAQAHDALEELRQCLRVHCSMLTFKREWVRGQGANTRAQNALARVHVRQVACTKRYRVAWEALKTLAPLLKKVGWRGRLQDLKDEDMKPLVDPFSRETEGCRRLTWIWMMTGVDTGSDGGDVDGVHVEWCKSRARAMCWAEEIELLQEEIMSTFGWVDGIFVSVPPSSPEDPSGMKGQPLLILVRTKNDVLWSSTLKIQLWTLSPMITSNDTAVDRPHYNFPPSMTTEIITPRRGALRCTGMVPGPYGTAVWVQSGDYSVAGLISSNVPGNTCLSRNLTIHL
ncbi:uncharacterized protein EDB91DRAFT_1249364 [Suillus paluster]|uniref:uncharacterized protein n=1 Tax=Suillus paluster TaxID=48578 RepID=UPI001B88647A|nr:uncharacterized protein EDB91DRAFT_1249364 [Suillus paluster]KAG1738452.1 hypothetical protein EDB91DRAFT_1249364 [Suillus paluster]